MGLQIEPGSARSLRLSINTSPVFGVMVMLRAGAGRMLRGRSNLGKKREVNVLINIFSGIGVSHQASNEVEALNRNAKAALWQK